MNTATLTLESGPPLAMLGVPFDNVTRPQVLARVDEMIRSRRPHYIATANVDFLVQALADIELRRILFDADLVLCDGTPLLWASRWLGNPLPERVAGSDLVPVLLEEAERKGYRLFFLGGSEEVAEAAMRKLAEKHPKLVVAGRYSPPISSLLEMDHGEIRRRITEARADIVFVSFGCPKQEKWITMNYRELGVPVSIGVGATIDFLAGKVSRAPLWMQRGGLEWVYRLLQEPGRLAKRYGHDLRVFGFAILQQWWQLRRRHRGAAPILPEVARALPAAVGEVSVLRLPARLDAAAVQLERARWEAVDRHHGLVLDLSETIFIDSTGVGLLMRLRRCARTESVGFALAGLQPVVSQAIATMKLSSFFPIATDVPDAKRLAAALPESLGCSVVQDASVALSFEGEVTAQTLDGTIRKAEAVLAGLAAQQEFRVDLSAVTFIDSTGVGGLVRLRKLAQRAAVRLSLSGPSAPVLNVLRLTRLEEYVLGGAAA